MPLNLHRRKNSNNWYIKGTVKVGDATREVPEKSTGISSKQVAEEYLARLTQQIQDELIHGPSGRAKHITFDMIGQSYLERPGGIAKGDALRIAQMAPYLMDRPIHDVPKGWQAFKSDHCKNLKPSTIARFRTTLVAALNYGCEQSEITAPRIPSIKVSGKRIRWLTMEEQEALLAAYAFHVRPIALTLCFQGCRSHEALDLDWRYVDMNRGTMFFSKTKNGEARSVLMHPRVLEAVRQLYVDRDGPRNGTVFLNRYGRPYSDVRTYRTPGGNPLSKAHGTACKLAGIVDFRPHDWRHHFACWAVMKGMPMKTLMTIGGWKSPVTMDRYTAVSTDHMDEAMRKIV